MRLNPRIVVPVTLALLVVAGLLTFLWADLTAAVKQFQLKGQASAWLSDTLKTTPDITDDTSGDKALLHLRQGDLLALAGDWKGAETEYRSSVDAGGGIAALKKLAQAQLQRRDYDGVHDTIERLQREGARSEDLLLLNVLVTLRGGDINGAKALLDQAGDSPQKHYALALLSIQALDFNQAKTELALVSSGWEPVLKSYAETLLSAYDEFALFPEGRDIHLETLIARALAQVQECEIALPILQKVTAAQDDYRDAWIVSGYCNLVTERNDVALQAFERAYALDPEKPEIQYFLGRTYAAIGDHRNAITFLGYALRNGFQPDRDVRRALADEAQASGDIGMAFDQYKALATASGADILSMQKFVDLAIAAQRPKDAYDVAKEAVTRWPDSGKAQAALGTAALALGNKEEARAAYEQAITLDPTLDDIKQKLVNL